MVRLDPDVMRAVGAVARVVVIARIPSDSLRSTWVEPGHACRLGRKESEGSGWLCTSCARPARRLVMRAGFLHESVVRGVSPTVKRPPITNGVLDRCAGEADAYG